ncbi:MAG: efflux RND transporter periplasmic adaptor subunit [Gemmatirosa sp.]
MRRRLHRSDLLGLLPAALALAGCGGEPEAVGQPAARERDRVEAVQVAIARLSAAARSVSATGTVEPLQRVGVVSQIGGVLQNVSVEEGDYVREGAVLARIAAPEVRAQLTSADAALEFARRTATRAEQLFRGGIITAAEHERDQAALVAAEATRDQLRARLNFATVRAPISGVVLERNVRTGDVASPQLRLFTVGDVSTLVVRVPVSERDVTSLRGTDAVEVTLDALPGRTFTGAVRRIFPAADSATRLVPVEVAIQGASARLVRPGFLARVAFRLEPRTDVLMVPGTAVLENPRGAVVYVVSGGRAALRPVERGTTYQGQVEITKGLAAGDSVVTAGNTMLRDGATVRVVGTSEPSRAPGDSARTSVGVRG